MKGQRGFTLTEMLVSLAITMLILVLGFTVCHHTLEVWSGGRQLLEKNAEARVAFDELTGDLQTLLLRQTDAEWFALTYDRDIGAAGGQTLSQMPWLRFAAGTGTVSYRMAWQDPVIKEGKHPVFGLYRSTGGISGLFPGEDDDPEESARAIAGKFWKKQQERLTEPLSLVAMHAVDFDVVVWHRNSDGARSVPGGTTVRVIGSRVETSPAIAGFNHVSQLEAIGVSLTSLSREGAAQLESGAMPLDEVVRKHGQHFATKVAVHSGGGGLP